MSDNSRDAYRSSEGEAETIRVVVLDGGRRHDGRVVDVSATGIGVVFESRVPRWEANSSLQLEIEHWKLPGKLEVEGILIHRAERRGRVRCGFRFANPSRLGRYSELFNRRRAFRVEPAIDEPVRVTLESEGGWARESRSRKVAAVPARPIEGRLFDVCAEGAGVLVQRDLRDRFTRRMPLTVTLALPEGSVKLTGRVARVAPRGGFLLVGLGFDQPATPEFTHEQAKVTSYVMARQRVWLQRTRNPVE